MQFGQDLNVFLEEKPKLKRFLESAIYLHVNKNYLAVLCIHQGGVYN